MADIKFGSDIGTEDEFTDDEVFQDAVEGVSDFSGSSPGNRSPEAPAEDINKIYKRSLQDLGLPTGDFELPSAELAEQSLDKELVDVKGAVGHFLNSEFIRAEEMLKLGFKKSLYFTHGYAVIMTLKSIMTFEPADIRNALSLLKTTVDISQQYRKSDHSILTNLQGFVKGYSLDNMTRLQRHAELVYAESYLLKALITIINDESFMSIVKEGVNIRFAYMTYKQCLKWIDKSERGPADSFATASDKNNNLKTWLTRKRANTTESPSTIDRTVTLADPDFVSGVRFGIGIFNLILSLLPARVLKVIESIGFSGSRSQALQNLEDPFIDSGLRHFMCEITLMVYHTILAGYISSIKPDHELVTLILERSMKKYPNGSLYLYFSGRLKFTQCDAAAGIEFYQKSISCQSEWVQLHHICYWEMGICNALLQQFKEASECYFQLEKESRWSKAVYKYLRAANLYMAREVKGDKSISQDQIDKLLKEVPTCVQKIAGRSIPIEKFAARKSRKYFMQDRRLFFPVFEMMMFWNGYLYMSPVMLQGVISILEKSLANLQSQIKPSTQSNVSNKSVKSDDAEDDFPYANFYDDYCLNLLILAICLREMKKYEESESMFVKLIQFDGLIKLDHYIAPCARFEFGRLRARQSRYSDARELYESARRDFKKFSLESQLHFRVHNALETLATTEITGE
eukprot:Partr_v1_DN26267_c0_g1_i1_m48235 putative tetratricopeptide repeat domain